MLFNYLNHANTDKTSLFFDYRTIQSETDWQHVTDVVYAFKLQLDCDCHVEVAPLKKMIGNLAQLYPNKPIFEIAIDESSWKAKTTKYKNLNQI
tara:strand:+ start:694 stop:975 length:282 start_codon:yes stop_codon:yes gene_type:complete